LNPLAITILMTTYNIDKDLVQEYTKKDIINTFLKGSIELSQFLSEVNKQICSIEIIKKNRVPTYSLNYFLISPSVTCSLLSDEYLYDPE
jgi:hypothetical protein